MVEFHKNTDESLVPDYVLPDVLMTADGKKIENAFDWVQIRRPEILALYKKVMYGNLPPRAVKTEFETISCKEDALNNTAIRKEIKLTSVTAISIGSSKSLSVRYRAFVSSITTTRESFAIDGAN